MSEAWVSVDEIARHLGVAKDTIYRWIESRSLPAHRVGRLWKFRVTEIDRWVQGGESPAEEHDAPLSRKRGRA